jgi:hypothetical protein
MGAALKSVDRWIYLMHQAHEANYYIQRSVELGHPHLWETSYPAILEFLAHFRSALNSYAKCFVSTGAGRMKLEGATVFASDQSLLDKHARIMELRHKYVAHSDANEFETARVVEEANDQELVLHLQYGLSFAFDRMYELRELIQLIGEHIVDKQRVHLDGIAREIGKPVRVREGP